MPFAYTLSSVTIGTTPYATSGSANTAIDFQFLKAGTGAKASIYNLRGQGRGAGLTALSGIALNVKNWTTASTGGTSMTPQPNSLAGAVSAQATAAAGASGGTGAVTSGSGGATFRGGFGFGASGPGGWVAATPDANIEQAAGSAGSLDLLSYSGTASLNFDWWEEFLE